MASLNVFDRSMFTSISLTQAVERAPYLPGMIGAMGIFTPEPIRTTMLAVETRKGKLTLIPFSERGEAGVQRTTEKRAGFYFKVPRLMTEDTITANEIQDIRAFGNETELMQVEAEVARRVSGPTGLMANLEYTKEYMRLAAVQGYLVDPKDGSVTYDMCAEFGVARPAVVHFDLVTPGALRPQINAVVRSIKRAAQDPATDNAPIVALCGDIFWDRLTQSPDVIRTFLNWSAAQDLRDGTQGAAFSAMPFSGVIFINYRGSNDNATISVGDNQVKFFPKSGSMFSEAMAPGESFEWVNTPGKPQYLLGIPDRDRNSFWKMELTSFPMPYCLRPDALATGDTP